MLASLYDHSVGKSTSGPRAVEGRQGQHVEDGEVDVVQDDELQHHGRAVEVNRFSLAKTSWTTRAIKPVIRLDTGPAKATQTSPFRQLRKLPGLIMTAWPSQSGHEEHHEPDGIDVGYGIQVRRPIIRGVSSPIQTATWAWHIRE